MSRQREGFTLVEVMIALVMGALVILVAHALFATVSDAAARSAAAARAADRAANRRAWLVRAFGGVVVASRPARGFRGLDGTRDGREADDVGFTALVRVANGLGEREVRIRLDRSDRLIGELRYPPGPRDAVPDTVVLADALLAFGVDYLLEYGAGARWVDEWVSPASAPAAARLRLLHDDGRADTLLLHIGVRG
ncbi:MAG TPA: prepilin-type N-terminal cleavage/methylation domain-containing protein [Gemmatimonadales bacterium]